MSPRLAKRRTLLIGGVCAANIAAAPTPPKMSRAAAQYQDRPRGGVSCIACTFFRKPDICQVVEGTVSPNGWCRLFDMPD